MPAFEKVLSNLEDGSIVRLLDTSASIKLPIAIAVTPARKASHSICVKIVDSLVNSGTKPETGSNSETFFIVFPDKDSFELEETCSFNKLVGISKLFIAQQIRHSGWGCIISYPRGLSIFNL